MTLTDSIAVVTGATEGIGRATAFALGMAGARVAICSRTASAVEATLRDLRAAGIEAAGTTCDVSQPDPVERFAKFVIAELGHPTILVNNAGIAIFGKFEEMRLEDWDAVINTNVRSLFLVTRAFVPEMKRRGRGDIVNVASLAGRNPVPGGVAYSASKHAVLGFSKSLLLEARKHGIRVVAICPGSVATPFFDKAGQERDPSKMLSADDVAATIVNVLSLPAERATVSELDIRPANP